jgi:hypothetical protein
MVVTSISRAIRDARRAISFSRRLTNAFQPRQAVARALRAKPVAARVTLPGATPPKAASPAFSHVRGGGAGRRVQTLV